MLLFKMPLTGTKREVKKFAYLPVRLGRGSSLLNSGKGGDIIWLEEYICVEEFVLKDMRYKWVVRERKRI